MSFAMRRTLTQLTDGSGSLLSSSTTSVGRDNAASDTTGAAAAGKSGDFVSCRCAAQHERQLICYTPRNCDAPGVVSCLRKPGALKATLQTDSNIATIPADSIIDAIEYYGLGSFSTKGEPFSIGAGLLNQNISMPLIEDGFETIANDKHGGCRHFVSCNADGSNDRRIVLYPCAINVLLNAPISCGYLAIVVRYHGRHCASKTIGGGGGGGGVE